MAEREELTPEEAARMVDSLRGARSHASRPARRDLASRVVTHGTALAVGLLVGWMAKGSGAEPAVPFTPARAPETAVLPPVPVQPAAPVEQPIPNAGVQVQVAGESPTPESLRLPGPPPASASPKPKPLDEWWKKLPGPGVWETPYRVSSEYDRFSRSTTYKTPWIGLPAHGFSLLAFFGYPDLDASAPSPKLVTDPDFSGVQFMLRDENETWRYLDHHPLYILVDGKRLEAEDVDHSGKVVSGGVVEYVRFRLRGPELAKLVAGEVVEIRVGIDDVRIQDPALVCLRELAHELRRWIEQALLR